MVLDEAISADGMALWHMSHGAAPKGQAVECLREEWADLFPGWRQLLVEEQPPINEGTWEMKASLEGCWRRLRVPCRVTLARLAEAICDAFGFELDFDHLYEFKYLDTTGVTVSVTHARIEDCLPADEVTMGEIPLRPGDEMLFRYDFGDNWRFQLTAESLLADKKSRAVRVIEKHGKAPRQYPEWE